MGFVIINMSANSYPFILTPVVTNGIVYQLFPTVETAEIFYCWILHILTLTFLGIILWIGLMARLLKKKERLITLISFSDFKRLADIY
jgi:hypothetical protein